MLKMIPHLLKTRPAFLVGLLATLASATSSFAVYETAVVARGLNRPTGIAVRSANTLFFTEVPTPGMAGGQNAVKELQLNPYQVSVVHQGEPDPVNIAIDPRGILYWTCRSAGVILEQPLHPGSASAEPLLTGLMRPTGIAIDLHGTVYFTQVPTPGVGGGSNMVSAVSVYDATMVTVLSEGEPEPADVAASRAGELYWTCKSAGVILTRSVDGVKSLLLSGLNQPLGIALDEKRGLLYWTEVPTPGVPGSAGGNNKVWVYDLKSQQKTLVDAGDPEPTDIAVAPNGNIYWTCSSAGVIVEARQQGE
jgi:hypothetical protein